MPQTTRDLSGKTQPNQIQLTDDQLAEIQGGRVMIIKWYTGSFGETALTPGELPEVPPK